jgi:adenosylcobinamide-GDP ribazoletransferase
MIDAWRLAVGTLTAVPVAPPGNVDRTTGRRAMLLAPLAVLPLAAAVVVIGEVGLWLDLPLLAVAFLAVGAIAAGSRALHWDGLSDVADGLTASYEKERSLAVMKTGTSGPAGVVATVVVAGVQVAALAPQLASTEGAVLAGAIVCASRCALTITCARGVPAARADGLGVGYTGTVPIASAVVSWLVASAVLALVATWAGLGTLRMVLTCAVAVLVVLVLVRRCVRRFGGVTGDVFGASIELSLATLLLGTG